MSPVIEGAPLDNTVTVTIDGSDSVVAFDLDRLGKIEEKLDLPLMQIYRRFIGAQDGDEQVSPEESARKFALNFRIGFARKFAEACLERELGGGMKPAACSAIVFPLFRGFERALGELMGSGEGEANPTKSAGSEPGPASSSDATPGN